MSEPATALVPVWEVAASEAHDRFDYGMVISQGWLLEHLRVEFPEAGRKAMDRARLVLVQRMSRFVEHMLTRYQKDVRALGARGEYVVVRPCEQHEHGQAEVLKYHRRGLRKGAAIVRHTRVDMLTDQQSRSRDETIGKIAAMEALGGKVFGLPDLPRRAGR